MGSCYDIYGTKKSGFSYTFSSQVNINKSRVGKKGNGNSRKIICLSNNKQYQSISEASKDLGIAVYKIRKALLKSNSAEFEINGILFKNID